MFCSHHILFSIASVAIFSDFFAFLLFMTSGTLLITLLLPSIIMRKRQLQNFADSDTEKTGFVVIQSLSTFKQICKPDLEFRYEISSGILAPLFTS